MTPEFMYHEFEREHTKLPTWQERLVWHQKVVEGKTPNGCLWDAGEWTMHRGWWKRMEGSPESEHQAIERERAHDIWLEKQVKRIVALPDIPLPPRDQRMDRLRAQRLKEIQDDT